MTKYKSAWNTSNNCRISELITIMSDRLTQLQDAVNQQVGQVKEMYVQISGEGLKKTGQNYKKKLTGNANTPFTQIYIASYSNTIWLIAYGYLHYTDNSYCLYYIVI